MNVTHICTKEREIDRLTRNDEKNQILMAQLSTKVTRIESDVKEIKKDMKDFIDSADHKYATKDELRNVEKNLKEANQRQDDQIKTMLERYMDIAFKVGSITSAVALLTKLAGLW